jgi:hypothetical protein
VKISPSKGNTGLDIGAECTAFYLSAEATNSGISGGANVIPGKVGCGMIGSYTWQN